MFQMLDQQIDDRPFHTGTLSLQGWNDFGRNTITCNDLPFHKSFQNGTISERSLKMRAFRLNG